MNDLQIKNVLIKYLRTRLNTPWYSSEMRRVVREVIRNAPDYFIDVLIVNPHVLDKLAVGEYKELVLEMMENIPLTTDKNKLVKTLN